MILFATGPAFGQVKIYLIGDSTMANKSDPENNPEHGWGQVLQLYFTDGVNVENRAVNGRSTKSFRELKHWQPIMDSLKKGDYVFIQFGHNDSKIKDPDRFTNPHSTYRHNLINYVRETRDKGATPVLLTSIVRRKFNENGVLVDTHGAYPLETRLVAQEMDVPLIDLQYFTELLETSYGPENSKLLHLHFEAGDDPFYPEGKSDDTHLSELGAREIAKIVAREIKKSNLPLSRFVKL